MLHRISPPIDFLWSCMSKNEFEKYLNLLIQNVNLISIKELNKKQFNNKLNLIITFDDGYDDFYINAFEIIKKNNVPININICPNLIEKNSLPWTQILNILLIEKNKKILLLLKKFNIYNNYKTINYKVFNIICNQIHNLKNGNYLKFINELKKINYNQKYKLLSWKDIIFLNSYKNIFVGNHSANHFNLNNLNMKQLNKEIIESKIIIEKKLGKEINIFSIPNGFYNKKIENILSKKYKNILFNKDKGNIIHTSNNNYYIDRINISINDAYEEFFRSIGFHYFFKKIINFLRFSEQKL